MGVQISSGLGWEFPAAAFGPTFPVAPVAPTGEGANVGAKCLIDADCASGYYCRGFQCSPKSKWGWVWGLVGTAAFAGVVVLLWQRKKRIESGGVSGLSRRRRRRR